MQAREGSAGGDGTPCFQIGKVGGQRPHGVVAHAFAGQMFKRRDVVVGQKRGELVAAIERQNGVERVQFLGTLENVIAWKRQFSARVQAAQRR